MNDEQTIIAQWADVFPEIRSRPTNDPRIFQTPFHTVQKPRDGILNGVKQKTYFACVVGGSCYGVDVYRQQAVNADKECQEAFFRVKLAADYFEQNGQWPPDEYGGT